MLILSLDTTTPRGSCALVRDGVVLREQAGDAAQSHAARLPGELMVMLEHDDVELREIDVYAVATGPGSFTGLRVGIATMQGLAFAAGKPLIGVSALDALATAAGGSASRNAPQVRVATWVDAWRGEVYAALYEGGREIEPPTVALPAALLTHLRTLVPAHREWCFIGDAAQTYRSLILAAMGDAASIADPATPLLAGTIALLAAECARAGEMPPPHAIRPLYVRRPDAELARDARHVR
jgi:tRNA threonylcarbamoyladenosine biosynthesis protein TsaB